MRYDIIHSVALTCVIFHDGYVPKTTITSPAKREAKALAFRKKLGERIRELRQAQGINQDDFSAKANIHRTHIGMLENAKIDPKLSTLINVANALDMDVWELLRLEDKA